MSGQVSQRVEDLKQIIRETPYDLLQNRIYNCVANSSLLLTSFVREKGAKGWSSKLVDQSGYPMLNSKEQNDIETNISQAPWLYDILTKEETVQVGGGSNPFLKSGSFVQTLSPEEISIDAGFEKFMNWTNSMNSKFSSIKNSSVGGLIKTFKEGDILIPTPAGVPVPVSKTLLYQLLMAILDSIRFTVALSGNTSFLLNFIALLDQLVTGQWRQMFITLVGFLNPSGLMISVIGKYVIGAWLLITPSLRDEMIRLGYKSVKSFLISFLVWTGNLLTPNTFKTAIEGGLQQIRTKAEGLKTQFQQIEEKGSVVLRPQGKELKFTKTQFLDSLSTITLDDIQNLQELLQSPVFICSKEVQDILTKLKEDPIFGFMLELLNVPIRGEDKLKVCQIPEPYPSITKQVEDMFTPDVIPIEQKGGKRKKQKSRKNRIKTQLK